MRIIDWSSDVCSSDLEVGGALIPEIEVPGLTAQRVHQDADDVLDVGDLHRPLADLEQRVPTHGVGVGRREIEDVAERLQVIGGDCPKERRNVVEVKSVSVSVGLGGGRRNNKKT